MSTNNPKSDLRRPIHSNPTRSNRIARAPYNFVPLPEKVVLVEKALLPDHDSYAENTYTGWFDCELETCSATYVRGMVTLAHLEKVRRLLEEYKCDDEDQLPPEKQIELKEERAPFYSAKPKSKVEELSKPMIPGSSLRGLIRSLVEIAGYGKMHWVNDSPKVTFRAVAASREDPLSELYRTMIGPFSSKVLAGYLRNTGNDHWDIQPAMKPKNKGWAENAAYLKIKESNIPTGAITGFVPFNDSRNYKPKWFSISFSATNESGRRVRFTQIGDLAKGYPNKGVLVCTGNMIESANLDNKKPPQKSPRRNHALVLELDKKMTPLPISKDVLNSYRDSLTPFQKDELWKRGGIEDGAPVFYITEKGSVIWFGHTPNFRIPALNKNRKPATPLDFIPDEIRGNEKPDLAEAIFGWVEEGNNLKGQRAGRVFFNDAEFIEAKNDVWYRTTPLAPTTLASPKITTFQHYLVQDKDKGHNPDFRQPLAHYGSKPKKEGEPEETEIRGHKLYWHRGEVEIPEAIAEEKESQRTRIIAVKPGVKFKFRVNFENLHDYELGALAWALQLPGEAGKIYRHKLGMGKPLGMGAVAITANLYITERRDKQAGRYARLFADGRLASGANADDLHRFVEKFESFVLKENQIAPDKQRLAEVPRIRMLLAMLEWREGTDEWLDKTRYLSIQHPQNGNEYKERPVLPDPLVVGGQTPDEATAERLGVVAYIPPGRPFGYIKPDVPRDNEEDGIFFDFEHLTESPKLCRQGQRVRFKVVMGERGPEARDVKREKQ